MTPAAAVELLDRYARVQTALEADDLDGAETLMAEIDGLIAQPPDGADQIVLAALAAQVEDAHRAALAAHDQARGRLLRAAQQELRAGGDGARAYAGGDERPESRFIDRTS